MSSGYQYSIDSDDANTIVSLACIPRETLQDLGIRHAQAGIALVKLPEGETVVKPYILKRPDIGSLRYESDIPLEDICTVYEDDQMVEELSIQRSSIYVDHQPLPATNLIQRLTESWMAFNASGPALPDSAAPMRAAFEPLYAEALREAINGTTLDWGFDCDKSVRGGVYEQAATLDEMRGSHRDMTFVEALATFRDFLILQSAAETSNCAAYLASIDESLCVKYNDLLKDPTTGQKSAREIVRQQDTEQLESTAATDLARVNEKWSEFVSKWGALEGTHEAPRTFVELAEDFQCLMEQPDRHRYE